jgi:hypothetical protein
MEVGQVIIDLRQVIPLQICPGEMMIILWYRGRRADDHRFRWVPDLWWEWKQDGRTVTVHLPKGAAVSERQDERLFEPFTPPNSCHTVAIPEGNHEIDLVLSWQRSGLPTFSVPLRINGPRWAFLRHPSDTPVWQVRPIEISPDDLLKEDSPCLLLEVRDITLREAELRAKWIGYAKEGLTVDLGAERQVRPDRWLIRLAPISDTLCKFQDADSHIIVEGSISGSHEARTVQVCVLRLQSPTMLHWAFQLDDSSSLEWSEVCIDLNPEDLIEGDSSHILFEAKGGRWVDAEVRTFWRPHDQAELSCELFPVTCTERGRWRIHLAPIMEFLEESSMRDSEVCLEAKVAGIQEGNKAEMALIRIHQHPASLLTYKDCKTWAEGNSLRILALDLLCDLHYKYRFSVDLLAIDWNTSPELVRRALLTVRIECPDVTVNERQNNFWMSKKTYRSMYPVLNEWNQQRMWKE